MIPFQLKDLYFLFSTFDPWFHLLQLFKGLENLWLSHRELVCPEQVATPSQSEHRESTHIYSQIYNIEFPLDFTEMPLDCGGKVEYPCREYGKHHIRMNQSRYINPQSSRSPVERQGCSMNKQTNHFLSFYSHTRHQIFSRGFFASQWCFLCRFLLLVVKRTTAFIFKSSILD